MIDLALTSPAGHITMNDVMVTIGATLAGLVAWRQREKDAQLKARDDTIEFMKTQITYLQNQLNAALEKNANNT